jgi:hypothetical protein
MTVEISSSLMALKSGRARDDAAHRSVTGSPSGGITLRPAR